MVCKTHSSTMQTHKVTVQGHGFEPWFLCPLCISFTPGRIFSKLWSLGQCAEPITQLCGLKVKVTIEGHELEPWIWCQLHISFTPGRIFFKCWSNVCLSEMMCRTHNSAMLTQGQGHNWRSAVSFLFAPYLLKPLKDFHVTLVKCLP